jgi:hypothetical protein
MRSLDILVIPVLIKPDLRFDLTYCGGNIVSVRFHHPGTVLQRLRQVGGLDMLAGSQVRDGARQLGNAVVGTRRQLQLVHG